MSSSRMDTVEGITIASILGWIIWFPPSIWVGPIPVYSGLMFIAETVLMVVLLMLWAWAAWTS